MFGNLGAFVNGNLFMDLFGTAIGVRLGADARTELMSEPGAGPFGPEGRPMREYTALPTEWRDGPEVTGTWVQQALDRVAAMAPK